MRLPLFLILFAGQATAWETTLGPICRLEHTTDTARVELTFDPSGPLYTITLTRANEPWEAASLFAMRFDGPRPNTISTNRHTLGGDGHSLTVADRGFGNVLDGLEFNQVATAFTDTQSVEFPLNGAAPEVRKFRNCAASPLA